MWTAIGGVVLGMVLWAAFASPVARIMPMSWQWPKRMAANTLNLPMREGGKHLLIADAPGNGSTIVEAWNVIQGDRKTVEGCLNAAAKAKNTVRCAIKIKPARVVEAAQLPPNGRLASASASATGEHAGSRGLVMKHKKLLRLYREENLRVRRRRGRKRAMEPERLWRCSSAQTSAADQRPTLRILALVVGT